MSPQNVYDRLCNLKDQNGYSRHAGSVGLRFGSPSRLVNCEATTNGMFRDLQVSRREAEMRSICSLRFGASPAIICTKSTKMIFAPRLRLIGLTDKGAEMGEQKTAVVFGGSLGIGEATAKILKYRGDRVVIVGRSGDRLAAAAERIGG